MNRQTHVTAVWRSVLTAIFGTLAILAPAAQGQSLTGALTPKSTAPAETVDPLGRTTPRTAIYGFLEACHSGNLTRAEQYLDLTRMPPGSAAADRARELGQLLDRDAHFEITQLDDTPAGRLDDGLAPNLDRLVTLTGEPRNATLYLQRVNRGGAQLWLVSADTVAHLPEWADRMEQSPIEKRLPTVLVRTQVFSTPVWILLTLALCAAIISLASRLLSRLAIALARPVAERYLKDLALARMQSFVDPLRLILGIAVFRACIEFAPPSALLRDALLKILALLFIIGAASLAMRTIDLAADQYISRLDPRERAMSYSLLPLLGRLVKMCVFCLGLLVVLREWGVDITAVLAGVGVGGLAIALAAQKTIENLFGGISVISDRPVLVGDMCQFGGQMGIVEDIGLRSTRIRTLDRTLVTVPNSQFSTMTLENFSRRDRFWFHPSLSLRRDTPDEKIQRAMQAIEAVLRKHPKVDPTDVPLRFTKITPEGYVLEIFSYVLTSDGNEFMRVQSELLFSILQALQAIEVRLAIPLQESVASS